MLICSKEAANVALNEYWNTIDPNGSNVGQNVMPGGLRVYNGGQIEAMQRAVEAALRLIDDAGEPVSVPPVPPAPFLTGAALHQREMVEGGPRPLDRLAGQIAGLADTVIRSEGRLADRVADLARLVVDLKTIPAPVLEVPTVELDWAAREPTEADLWEAALNMAAAQRDRKSLDGARVLREALWFLRQLQDGPPADDEIDDDPEPAAEDVGPPFARPHLFSAVKSSGGLCDVAGCSRPLMDDIHKLPGNGYAGPNPITAPAG